MGLETRLTIHIHMYVHAVLGSIKICDYVIPVLLVVVHVCIFSDFSGSLFAVIVYIISGVPYQCCT